MKRKIILYLMLACVAGAAAYFWLHYAIVAFYDKDTYNISHVYVVTKPERGVDFFYMHSDRKIVEKEIANLREKNQPIPWHMDYNEVLGRSIYDLVLDSRVGSQRPEAQ
ncbi:MAG: hypothetical protein SV487_03120 [Thermodesulfobacteriota bacterium]|nr:hypothetical protein [Thermodesulfobacteriota bacterium]